MPLVPGQSRGKLALAGAVLPKKALIKKRPSSKLKFYSISK